jgi:hypothetical protein
VPASGSLRPSASVSMSSNFSNGSNALIAHLYFRR